MIGDDTDLASPFQSATNNRLGAVDDDVLIWGQDSEGLALNEAAAIEGLDLRDSSNDRVN